MTELYAVFLEQASHGDIDTISDIAALTNKNAREVADLLRQGGQLSHAMEQHQAECLAEMLRLLGLELSIKATQVSPYPKPQAASQQPQILTGVSKPRPAKASRKPTFIVALGIVAIVIFFWSPWAGAAKKPASGMLAPNQPVQLDTEVRPWLYKDHLIRPLAQYDIEARVLATKRYRFGRGGKLSPVDAALGWGAMSDTAVLDELKFSQRGRWYYVNWRTPPLPSKQIMNNSANTHLIPANNHIARKIKGLKTHDVVTLKGYLVEISATDGFVWRSSLSRLDRGNGGCELFWVADIEVRH